MYLRVLFHVLTDTCRQDVWESEGRSCASLQQTFQMLEGKLEFSCSPSLFLILEFNLCT